MSIKPVELTPRQEAIVPISAFTANGDLGRLKTSLVEGLEAGLTINDIKEVLVQLYASLGYLRALNGLGTFMAVVNERRAAGIRDEIGNEPNPLPKDKTRLELGTEIQAHLIGAPVKLPILDFAPAIDAYLKDHLFGDIFGRDNLNFQDREIATIAALAVLAGVEPQLQSHFKIAMNIGLTDVQIKKIIALIGEQVGRAEGVRALAILEKIFAS